MRIEEKMRVEEDNIMSDGLKEVKKGKIEMLLRNQGMEEEMQKKIEKLIEKVINIVELNGVEKIIGLLESIGRDGEEIMIDIKREKSLGIEKGGNDLKKKINIEG